MRVSIEGRIMDSASFSSSAAVVLEMMKTNNASAKATENIFALLGNFELACLAAIQTSFHPRTHVQ